MLGGGLVAVSATVPLVTHLVTGRHFGRAPVAISLMLVVYVGIFAGYFLFASRVGVKTSSDGVESVSLSRRCFVAWGEVSRFVVARYTPLSMCIQAERTDGVLLPMNALAVWAFRSKEILRPYCEELNDELQTYRATEPRPPA